MRTRGTRLLIFFSLYSRRSFLLISLAFENPVEGRTKIWQLYNLILTLFGLIFRRIYIYICYFFRLYMKRYPFTIVQWQFSKRRLVFEFNAPTWHTNLKRKILNIWSRVPKRIQNKLVSSSAHSFNLMRFAALVIIFSISTCNYPIVVWSCD